jgi:3-oxoadipate CoA-transferase alpha subunit
MINKLVETLDEALGPVPDGSTILVGGFGAVGQPDALIEAIIAKGVKDLTIVANNAGYGKVGLALLLATGRVRKIICSFPRITGSTVFEELYKAGRIELELVPQGTLAERMRAAGAGIPAFFTPTGAGTLLAEGKETRTFDGREYVMEKALHGDIALIDAWEADRWGNLTYRESARNFNPVMATAAKRTVVQAHNIAELGELDPERIVTQGIFVDKIIPASDAAKQVEQMK